MDMRNILIAFFLPILTLAACGKEPAENNQGQGPDSKAPTQISFSEAAPVLPAEAGSFTLTVTAPSRPKAASSAEWLTVKDGVYNSATYKITYTVSYAANATFGDRSADLTFTAGSLNTSVSVTQKGLSVPEIDKSKIPTSPVNASATASAKKLYTFLRDNYGVKTLSGVQSCMAHTNDYVDAVAALTGKHPALAGYDFLYLQFSPTPANWSWKQDYTDVSNQVEHWNAGGIICYMWHWNAPKDEETFRNNTTGEGSYAFYSKDTPFDIREALKEGTWQHEFILQDIDEVAYTLKLLQDKGIPVLFRPLHEAAGNYGGSGAWFWWGKYGPEYCKQLWNLLQDRLQNHHGLNNILWVWTVDCKQGKEEEAAQWYPGDDRVDIVGFDVYADDTDAKTMQYAYLDKIAGGKKIYTVSECGNIPSPTKNLVAGLPWSWFMVWSTKGDNDAPNPFGYPLNTESYWKELMGSNLVITREEMPSLK